MNYCIMTFAELQHYIGSDLYRYMGTTSARAFFRGWFIAGFRYTFFMRCCKYFHDRWWGVVLFVICRIVLRYYSIKYGFQIPWQTDIGPGFYIGHFGSIIINPSTVIGSNCNVTTGVLLGIGHKVTAHGRYPVVGNRVVLSNNSKIIGGVWIGDGAMIGVSSVVTHDVPEEAVMVGAPARQISSNGSAAFITYIHPWTLKFMSSKS